jgi:hypothetical protein
MCFLVLRTKSVLLKGADAYIFLFTYFVFDLTNSKVFFLPIDFLNPLAVVCNSGSKLEPHRSYRSS